jgi:hypothetical protein
MPPAESEIVSFANPLHIRIRRYAQHAERPSGKRHPKAFPPATPWHSRIMAELDSRNRPRPTDWTDQLGWPIQYY